MRLEYLSPASITVLDRRRQPRNIEALTQAIRDRGRVLVPIEVNEAHELIAGFRRLESVKTLGWDKIPVLVYSDEEVDAALDEIAENLHREELTALERAEQEAEWKAKMLARHPEKGRGKAPGAGKGKGKKPPLEKRHHDALPNGGGRKKKRTRERSCQIAESIPKDIRDMIRETPVATNQEDLLRLARMKEDEQRAVAEKIAEGEGKNVRHASKLVKADEISAEPPPLPKGPFRVLVIDPPWHYGKSRSDAGNEGGLEYPTMTTEQIIDLPVVSMAHEDCILWLWTTNAHMRDAFKILDAWGFEQKTILTWAKERPGLGEWMLGQTEHCLLATRGNPVNTLTNQSTLLFAARRQHSRKPEEFYQMVDSLCPGSKCELFGRSLRAGWTVWGNERNLFSESA